MGKARENLYASTDKVRDANLRTLKRMALERFKAARRIENEYLKSLRQVSRQIDNIVKGMAPKGQIKNPRELAKMLQQYAQLISPWAKALAEKMVKEIATKNKKAWESVGNDVGKVFKRELEFERSGQLFQQLQNEQIVLITSLPLEAAERVHKLAAEAQTTGARPKQIADAILATGSVTKSRANTIARTEVARASSLITQARATELGITHYVWRTSQDSDVRTAHKEMNGKVIAFDNPPTLSDGTTTHAGQIYNCRCYPEPIITED